MSKAALKGIRDALEQLSNLAVSIRQSSVSTTTARIMAFREKEQNQEHFRRFGKVSMVVIERLYPSAAESLRDRLHESMLDRYAKLRYWDAHNQKLNIDSRKLSSIGDTPPQPLTATEEPSNQLSSASRSRGVEQRVNFTKDDFAIHSDTEPTTMITKAPIKEEQHTFFPTPAATSARFVRAVFPSPPKLAHDKQHGLCPFCRRLHSRAAFNDRRWWE